MQGLARYTNLLDFKPVPFQQLRKKLKPELQELVNSQRLTVLEAGENMSQIFSCFDQKNSPFPKH